MSENENQSKTDLEGVYSKVMRAGRRTYFFDVRETRAGDYYLTITESKRNNNEDGTYFYKKHKIYLYKEDFENFKENLEEVTNFVVNEKGEEVISDKHQENFNGFPDENELEKETTDVATPDSFTDVNFEDI